VEKNQVPAEQNQQRSIRKCGAAGQDFDGALRLYDAVSPFEKDQRLIFLLPDRKTATSASDPARRTVTRGCQKP